MTTFWGLVMEPGKRYKQQVEEQFHLTMAVLDTSSVKGNQKNANLNVMVETRSNEFILCTLNAEKNPQKRLDLMFAEGETVSFFIAGEGTVHLTGYVMPEDMESDMYGDEFDEEDEMDDEPVVNGKRKHPEQLQLQGKKLKASEPEKKQQPAKQQKIIDVDPKQLVEKNKKGQQQQQQQQKKQPAKPAAQDDSDDDLDDDVDSDIDSEELNKLIEQASDEEDDDLSDDFEDDDDDDDVDDDDLDDDDSSDAEKLAKAQLKLKANLSGPQGNKQQQGKTPNNKQQQQGKTPNKQQQQQGKAPQQQGKTPQQQGKTPQQQGKTPQQQQPKTPQQQKNNQNNNQNRQQTPFVKGNKQQQQQQQNSNKKGSPFQKNQNSNQKDDSDKTAAGVGQKSAVEPKESVKKLPNGLVIHDLQEGSGPEAKKGKFLHMNYVGKLTNNRVFDKTTNRPFSFRLGMGEVIKGWDQGIQGMKVGGKRRLTIPSSLGYGKVGAGPDIPPNATLVFDVELKGVSS